jgi:uncharacterized DUF497 family protein
MADTVNELLATETAVDKLGARNISIEEAHQLLRNASVTVRNPHHHSQGKRRLLVGRTDGGRTLTLVIEATNDPTTWLIITGWDATPRERTIVRS